MSPSSSNFIIAIPTKTKKKMGDKETTETEKTDTSTQHPPATSAAAAAAVPAKRAAAAATTTMQSNRPLRSSARINATARWKELANSPYAMGSARRKRQSAAAATNALGRLRDASSSDPIGISDDPDSSSLSELEEEFAELVSESSDSEEAKRRAKKPRLGTGTSRGLGSGAQRSKTAAAAARLPEKKPSPSLPPLKPGESRVLRPGDMTEGSSHDDSSDNDSDGSVVNLIMTDDDDYNHDNDNDESDVGDGDGNSTHDDPERDGNPPFRRSAAERLRAHRAEIIARRRKTTRGSLEQHHPFVSDMWETLRNVEPIQPVAVAQPPGITRDLKPFQLEGLDWMIKQEASQWKGGLLGDEMGMGKTIQAVSLLMSDFPAKLPSLVVVPPVALMQWQSEIKAYTSDKLKVLIYHNSTTKTKLFTTEELASYDVIIVSYSGLESLYRKQTKGWNRGEHVVKEDSPIHALKFHRLILDEAHNIKQRTTGVAKACFALKANYKWCLSGTPVQNRIGEFFSLLRFLDVKPFACYICKKCPCQSLQWVQDEEKKCTECRHTGFEHVSLFNQEILNPLTADPLPQEKRLALDKLRLLTDRIMLRRVKMDHTRSMELPPKKIILNSQFFGEIERDFSTSIMTNTTRQFETYVSRGVMLSNYANIFGLIMQMRQVANHPDLIVKKQVEGAQTVLVCCICDEPAEEPIRSRCHHEFCRQCAREYVNSFKEYGEPDCPRCHIPLAIDFEQPHIEQRAEGVKKSSIINRISMESWTSSTKIEMLVYELYKLRSKKQTQKSIVFSQFTSMLQLVEWRLRRAGFSTVMLDGSMTPAQRQKSIEYFMKNVNVEVFLVSLKAGGVALNLTEASRVFIVDPWWNPAAEWQSADRCHRIGQRRPCVITRLCIEDSVESRMVLLQEKKANMINGTINKNQNEALEKLTPEDMEFLFRGN
ncbi:DNA repair protein rad16 [Ascosphaera pollenicola]|nr:DNA repair protein rad16 [Ascosphaera pollenicola]